MPYAVSLNGVDNVGKTTQIELLPSHYTVHKAKGLHESDEKTGELHRRDLLRDWWWNSPNEEFVRSIFGALVRGTHNSIAVEGDSVTIFDRGVAMFEAVAVATIAFKSPDHNLDKARATLHTILESSGLQVPKENLAILLKHGDTLEDSIQITMSRESDPSDERYRLYQNLLHIELQRQESSKVYQQEVRVDTMSGIGKVQDRIREIILRYTQNRPFLPMLQNLDCIYALSGFSEAGKSSVAEALCSHYGTSKAFRAKIVYFNDVVSEKFGKSIYGLSERDQALHLLHELERFSNAHYWLRLITTESLHRHSVAMWLKTWLGNRFQVIYIDIADAKRFERARLAHQDVISNDALKRERGVDLIWSDADLILDNNGTLTDTVSNLLRFVGQQNKG